MTTAKESSKVTDLTLFGSPSFRLFVNSGNFALLEYIEEARCTRRAVEPLLGCSSWRLKIRWSSLRTPQNNEKNVSRTKRRIPQPLEQLALHASIVTYHQVCGRITHIHTWDMTHMLKSRSNVFARSRIHLLISVCEGIFGIYILLRISDFEEKGLVRQWTNDFWWSHSVEYHKLLQTLTLMGL
jgi:hypothetical protein